MPWLSDTAPRCYRCKRPRREGERFSRRGRCADCGEGAMLTNVRELRDHTGESFRRWRRGMAASVGAVIVDDLETDD